jgi:hypothetical protein
MGGAVRAHEACAVNHQGDGQLLKAHVHQHLVVGALQKRGVDGHIGAHATDREPPRPS